MPDTLRLLLVSADPLARAALSTLLQGDSRCTLVDIISPSAFTGDGADQTSEWDVDAIVWDCGLEAAEFGSEFFADFEAPVIALLAESEQAGEALAAGALGLVRREMDIDHILGAANAAVSGLTAIHPEFLSGLSRTLPAPASTLAESLTRRELEVLQLLAEGLTNRAIASRLEVSEHTVKFHVNSILNKLDAQSRTEAVVSGTRLGLIAL